jgi:hypothetical protein
LGAQNCHAISIGYPMARSPTRGVLQFLNWIMGNVGAMMRSVGDINML